MCEPFEESGEEPRRRIFYEGRKRSSPSEKNQGMCGYVPTGPGCHHASWQASRAVMVGVEGKDWEDVVLQTSSTFWKFIEERRKEPTMSMKELRTRLKNRKK
jgi:hypothetical protein